MGVGMAGMLAPGLGFGTSAAWTAVFSVAAARFAWQVLRVRRGLGAGRWRCPYPVPHLAESLAMVYMVVVAVRTPTGPGAGAGAVGMGGTVPARAAHADGCWPALAPRGACCYEIVMAYMLVVML